MTEEKTAIDIIGEWRDRVYILRAIARRIADDHPVAHEALCNVANDFDELFTQARYLLETDHDGD